MSWMNDAGPDPLRPPARDRAQRIAEIRAAIDEIERRLKRNADLLEELAAELRGMLRGEF